MCLSRLFGGDRGNGCDCTWIRFIIILVLLLDDDNCGNNGCGCGC